MLIDQQQQPTGELRCQQILPIEKNLILNVSPSYAIKQQGTTILSTWLR